MRMLGCGEQFRILVGGRKEGSEGFRGEWDFGSDEALRVSPALSGSSDSQSAMGSQASSGHRLSRIERNWMAG